MITIDRNSPIPINEQIKAGLRGLVARGLLRPGDPAPSVRGLAAELKVNANTVARALRELALEGFLLSRRGETGKVTELALLKARESRDELRRHFEEAVALARRGGLSWEEIHEALRAARRREP